MNVGDSSFCDPSDIANAFAMHFKSVYQVSDPCLLRTDTPAPAAEFMFSTEDVVRALKSLKSSAVAGPDGVPCFLLRDCALIFAKPLHTLFRLSCETCSFPSLWKAAIVTPIHKQGEKSNITNYRPVVLLNSFSKVFESLVYDAMYHEFSKQLSPYQHGFTRGRSTRTNLFLVTQFIASNIDDKAQTDVLYTDFAKAFDTVDHSILLNKILTAGFSLSCALFLKSYLSDRTMTVRFKGFVSEAFSPTSGVPQGSNLGPLLFLIFVNDILNAVSSRALLFADDLKLFARVSSVSDCERVQRDIDTIERWCSANRLALNAKKCYVMSFSLKKSEINYDYRIGTTSVARPEVVRDLGVVFDKKLSFVPHINAMVSGAFKSMGFIIRNSKELSVSTLTHLFQTLVLPRLDYCSIVWSPSCANHVGNIESIQRHFLKFLSFRLDDVYPARGFPQIHLCGRFSMLLTSDRRSRASVMFLHQIVAGDRLSCPDILSQLIFHVPRNSRLPDDVSTFYLPTPRTNVLKFSPLYQMCRSYSEVSPTLDLFSCSVADIKKSFSSAYTDVWM